MKSHHSFKSHRDTPFSLSLEFYISKGTCSLHSHRGKEVLFTFFPSMTQPTSNTQRLVPQGFSISFLSHKVTATNGHVHELRPCLYPRGPLEGQDTQGLKWVHCKEVGNNIRTCKIPTHFYRYCGVCLLVCTGRPQVHIFPLIHLGKISETVECGNISAVISISELLCREVHKIHSVFEDTGSNVFSIL